MIAPLNSIQEKVFYHDQKDPQKLMVPERGKWVKSISERKFISEAIVFIVNGI